MMNTWFPSFQKNTEFRHGHTTMGIFNLQGFTSSVSLGSFESSHHKVVKLQWYHGSKTHWYLDYPRLIFGHMLHEGTGRCSWPFLHHVAMLLKASHKIHVAACIESINWIGNPSSTWTISTNWNPSPYIFAGIQNLIFEYIWLVVSKALTPHFGSNCSNCSTKKPY